MFLRIGTFLIGFWFLSHSEIGLAQSCLIKPEPGPQSSYKNLCDAAKKIRLYGHRGMDTAPENTIPAFEAARDAGADAIELDIQVSKDGQLMVAHDSSFRPGLCRSPDGKELDEKHRIYFHNLTKDEIQKFDCGAVSRPASTWRKGAQVPTLLEVLQTLKSWKSLKGQPFGVIIEIKFEDSHPELYPSLLTYTDLVLKTIDASEFPISRLMIHSFKHDTLSLIKRSRPEIAIAPLVSDKSENLLKLAKKLHPEFINPYVDNVDQKTVTALHEMHTGVNVWTVDSCEQIKHALEIGVDGIITNKSDLFRDLERQVCLK